MKSIGTLLSLLILSSCASVPDNVQYSCQAKTLSWAFGPNKSLPYIDVCSVSIDGYDLKKVYNFVPIAGINADTRQQIDPDRNGLSGNGQWRNDRIHWGGDSCEQYVRRIAQKNCGQFGNNQRSGGCEWIALQIVPKKNIKEAFVSLTPLWHVRLPDGRELDLKGNTLTPAFQNCR